MKEEVPLVSIYCVTYNHEKYIAQAIESFLMQQTTFDVEIIICEDKSTDNTAKIIAEYEKRFPGRLSVFYHQENLYSQKIDSFKTEFLATARGKYCAVCDGDDYWTDPFKLQKQVDILEEHPDCSLAFHNAQIVFEHVEREPVYAMNKLYKNKLKLSTDILINFEYNITAASMLFRRDAFKPGKNDGYTSEKSLQLAVSTNGNIIYLNDIMSVYRSNDRGVSYHNTKLRSTMLMIGIYNWFDLYSKGVYAKVIRSRKIQLMSEYAYNRIMNSKGRIYVILQPLLLSRLIYYKIRKYYRILALNFLT